MKRAFQISKHNKMVNGDPPAGGQAAAVPIKKQKLNR